MQAAASRPAPVLQTSLVIRNIAMAVRPLETVQ